MQTIACIHRCRDTVSIIINNSFSARLMPGQCVTREELTLSASCVSIKQSMYYSLQRLGTRRPTTFRCGDYELKAYRCWSVLVRYPMTKSMIQTLSTTEELQSSRRQTSKCRNCRSIVHRHSNAPARVLHLTDRRVLPP